MQQLLWVCAGGALGSGLRHLVQLGAARFWGHHFPIGTLIVNVLGCFLMGAIASYATSHPSFSPVTKAALAGGLLGGFTTYSSFNLDTTQLAQGRGLGMAGFYLVLTIVVGLLAGAAGAASSRLALGR